MPLQIVTASFALLFATCLLLSSNRFVEARAPGSINPAVAARGAR